MKKHIHIINDYFDKIYCLNLDKRKDRWIKTKKKLDEFGINVERFPAIDGDDLTDEQLKKYDKINKYEIGCMLSHYGIIKEAKEKHYKRILIFEDDVMFIENFKSKFLQMINKIPDWKLLYLGGSQHNWDDIEFIDDFYYTKHMSGCFAYAVDESIYDEILNTNNINDKAIDYKLFDIQEKYHDKCYSCFPNLVICDVTESDIRKNRDMETHSIKMKWDLDKYK